MHGRTTNSCSPASCATGCTSASRVEKSLGQVAIDSDPNCRGLVLSELAQSSQKGWEAIAAGVAAEVRKRDGTERMRKALEWLVSRKSGWLDEKVARCALNGEPCPELDQ